MESLTLVCSISNSYYFLMQGLREISRMMQNMVSKVDVGGLLWIVLSLLQLDM
jgi:hypothetical protein